MRNIHSSLALVLMAGFTAHCGKAGVGAVTISNAAFALASTPAREDNAGSTAASGSITVAANAPAVTELKICVKRIRLEDAQGKTHTDRDSGGDNGAAAGSGDQKNAGAGDAKGETASSASTPAAGDKREDDATLAADELRFAPGLIDLSSGQAIDWGIADIPTGFKLARLVVKVKKDKTLCGVDYSVAFNGQTTDQDVEFRFRFDPAIDLSTDTKAIEVSLDQAVASLRNAAATGNLQSLKDDVEKSEGSGKHKEDTSNKGKN